MMPFGHKYIIFEDSIVYNYMYELEIGYEIGERGVIPITYTY